MHLETIKHLRGLELLDSYEESATIKREYMDLAGALKAHDHAEAVVKLRDLQQFDEPDHAPMPLAYFVNGYQRHHEKLSGMAGDWMDNRLHACEPNVPALAQSGGGRTPTKESNS
jgi:hypothetical protein